MDNHQQQQKQQQHLQFQRDQTHDLTPYSQARGGLGSLDLGNGQRLAAYSTKRPPKHPNRINQRWT